VAPGLREGISGQPGPAPDAFRQWTPDAQQRALDLLRTRLRDTHRPFYCPDPDCTGEPHGDWDFPHARADQRPPSLGEDWLTWLLLGGRGGGKTRAGAQFSHQMTRYTPRIGLIAPTGPDIRDIMVEGVSGIQATAHPDNKPEWEPSKKKLTWPNGSIGQCYSGEEPDRLRGPQFGFVWIDEPAHTPLIDDVWSNMLLGLRLGRSPRVCATTTPTPIKWVKTLVADPLTRISRFSTYANLGNLADTFKRTVLDRYEGTRLGRQELHGEILLDVEGALWKWDMFQRIEQDQVPPLARVVVGIDPAGSTNKSSDATGIITVGVSARRDLYVLGDRTGRYSPADWALAAYHAYTDAEADCLVPEKNYGGDMVTHTLESTLPVGTIAPRIKPVNSRRGKEIRAEPVVALYEKRRIFHVGNLDELEGEQTSWVPGRGASPNRVDALVHAVTELAKAVMPVEIGNPLGLDELMRLDA
jgi:phage terminase large subunit-like protein